MKKLYLFLLFCGFAFPVFCQVSDVQVDRRIYLWDVTLSMKGYGGKPDIWNDVTAFIKRDIENLSDENTELVILPFQEDVLVEDWSYVANKDGKTKMLRHIDDAKKIFKDTTYTNIAGPFKKVMDKYIDKKRNNLVILLTDGQHSGKYGGQAVWRNLLSSWHPYAKDNNAYLIYVMLTEEAIDEEVRAQFDTISTGLVLLPEESTFEYINFRPKQKVKFNVSGDVDEVEIRIPLENAKRTLPIPEGVRMSVKSAENAFIEIDEEVEVVDEVLNVKLKYSSQELKDIMGIEEMISIPLTLEILNQDKIQARYHKRLVLMQNSVELELINKIQKILTITLKQ